MCWFLFFFLTQFLFITYKSWTSEVNTVMHWHLPNKHSAYYNLHFRKKNLYIYFIYTLLSKKLNYKKQNIGLLFFNWLWKKSKLIIIDALHFNLDLANFSNVCHKLDPIIYISFYTFLNHINTLLMSEINIRFL